MEKPSDSGAGEGGDRARERERPRFFDKKAKNICWSKADILPGRHPDRWRRDAAGNIVCKRFCNCSGCLCFEYDHIVPFSKGGESTTDNCQILQTRVNRYKSDKEIDPSILRGYSCDLKFSGDTKPYVDGLLGIIFPYKPNKVKSGEYKELDIIEMAVYGDVIRPGNQCRCRSIAEMIGKFKSKDHFAACKLPNSNENPQV